MDRDLWSRSPQSKPPTHCWWPWGPLAAQHPGHSPCQQRQPGRPLSPSGFCGLISFFLLGSPSPRHEAEGRKLWEKRPETFKQTNSYHLPIHLPRQQPSRLGCFPPLPCSWAWAFIDLLTLHWWQWGLRRKWCETAVLPPAELPVIRSWIKNFLHHQMRRTLQDRKEQTEEKYRGARPRHGEKPGPQETQAAPEQSGPAWIRPCHVLDWPKSSSKFSQRNLWKNPNEFLILVMWPKISPFSSWSSSFFQTYLHGGWGPNGAKKAPKCPDIEQWRPPSFFCQTHLFISIFEKEFLENSNNNKENLCWNKNT